VTLKSKRDQKVELACVVTEAARQVSKKDGSEWGRVTVEDFHGTATILAFGDSWAKYKEVLKQDAAVVVRGAVSSRERDEEDPPMFLDSAIPLERVRESGEVGVVIEIGSAGPAPQAIESAKNLIAAHAGEGPVFVLWKNGGGDGDAPRLRSKSLKVAPRDEVIQALRDALGDERVRLHRDPPALGSVPQRDEPWRNRRPRAPSGAEE